METSKKISMVRVDPSPNSTGTFMIIDIIRYQENRKMEIRNFLGSGSQRVSIAFPSLLDLDSSCCVVKNYGCSMLQL